MNIIPSITSGCKVNATRLLGVEVPDPERPCAEGKIHIQKEQIQNDKIQQDQIQKDQIQKDQI